MQSPSYELVLRVLVQWSEKYHEEHPNEEHPLWDLYGPYNVQHECRLPSHSYRNIAHVSRWFHKRLFQQFSFFFQRWMEYVDSGFVEACLNCEHFKKSQLVYNYGRGASLDCPYHAILRQLEIEEGCLDDLVMMRSRGIFGATYEDIETRISVLQWDLRRCSCFCDWRKCDLGTIVLLCLSAKETLEIDEPGTQIFFDKASRKLIVWEEDIDGYESDYAEETACQLLKVC